MSDGKIRLILTLPGGVSERDLEGLLEGFSKATASGSFHMDRLPAAYGNSDGMLFVPIGHLAGAKMLPAERNQKTYGVDLTLHGLDNNQIRDLLFQLGIAR